MGAWISTSIGSFKYWQDFFGARTRLKVQKVAKCYEDVRSAGFVVDSHTCYRGITNSTMRFGPTKLSSTQLLRGYKPANC